MSETKTVEVYSPPNPFQPADRQNASEEGGEDPVFCDLCNERTDTEDDESRSVYAGDESMTMCEGCAEHYLD